MDIVKSRVLTSEHVPYFLLFFVIRLALSWAKKKRAGALFYCPGQDSNLHYLTATEPKSVVSTNSTTWAGDHFPKYRSPKSPKPGTIK
jgi:hypothetical protein